MYVKFSIAIATFNSSDTIEELLSSIYNQTYTNYEVIFVDGKSIDNTVEIIQKYKQKNDKLISEPDGGVYDAMNKAIDLATGDYLIFMGSDDHFIAWNVLQNIANEITEKEECVYYGNVYMEGYKIVWRKKFSKWDWVRGTICHQALLYPKHIYKKYKYDLKYKINADYDYNLSLFNKVKFKHIDIIISYFSASGLSSSNYDAAWQHDLPEKIKEKIGYIPYLYKKLRILAGKIFKER